MARTKRNKVVPLTKVGKKNFADKKVKLVNNIHKLLDDYTYCFAFMYKNMTSMPMIELRNYWSNSVFLIGKNKVMQVALGKTQEDEHKENSHMLSPFLANNCGLFFTKEDPQTIIEYFNTFKCPYYGNVGTVSTETVILKRGHDERLDEFPPQMESQFRQLGLQIKLENGKFVMLDDYVVCKEGEILKPDQAKMIKHLGIQMDEFKITLKAYLGKDGQFVDLSSEMMR